MNRNSLYFLALLFGFSCVINVMGTGSNCSGPSLPKVGEGKVIRLALDAKGGLKFNGKAVDLKDLKKQLLNGSRKPENLEILLSANDDCPEAHLMELLGALADAGVSKITLEGFDVPERKNPWP